MSSPDLPAVVPVEVDISERTTSTRVLGHLSSYLESAALRDGIKLILLGGVLGAAKKGIDIVGQQILERFTIQALFRDTDSSYDYLMAWLATDGHRARTFEVQTLPEKDRENAYDFLPSPDTVRWIAFEGRMIRAIRKFHEEGFGDPRSSLELTVFAQDQDIIRRLINEARTIYRSRQISGRITIYTPDRSLRHWNRSQVRPPRTMDSVILPEGVKERILADIDEFLKGERWYVDRGIPHRRGYLLSGVPGSGKTSLITALAGHLSLDLYVVNLSQKGLDDVALNDLWNSVPEGSILLMEDLDCAFASRISDETEEGTNKWGETIKRKKNGKVAAPLSSVSLAGILNSLDGVSAQSGSIVFATTNHVDRLDPALRRPGRMDVHLEFENATRAQARDLFLHFYPSKSFRDARLEQWADTFAGAVPEKVTSIASLQGFLMDYKADPEKAAVDVIPWTERTTLSDT